MNGKTAAVRLFTNITLQAQTFDRRNKKEITVLIKQVMCTTPEWELASFTEERTPGETAQC